MTTFLLPHSYKKFGWFILVPSIILGIFYLSQQGDIDFIHGRVPALIYDGKFLTGTDYFGFVNTELSTTILGILLIVGALLVGFSKEKIEDEYIQEIRLSALLWSVLVNYLILLLAFLFIYGTKFFDVMLYNMFTVLLLFIMRFHYLMYKSKNEAV